MYDVQKQVQLLSLASFVYSLLDFNDRCLFCADDVNSAVDSLFYYSMWGLVYRLFWDSDQTSDNVKTIL